MHRSRLPLLVIVAAVAACSTQKDSETKTLSQDSTLAAQVEIAQQTDQKTDKGPLPDACGAAVSIPDQPTPANKARAQQLTRQAHEAEVLGNVQQASSLLRRASELDWTDKSSAYHLGRVSETLGDRTAAIAAYCRYLALAPTMAEGGDARQRLADLSQSSTRVAAASVVDSVATHRAASAATARRVPRQQTARQRRQVVANGTIEQPVRPASPMRDPRQANAPASSMSDSSTPRIPVSNSPGIASGADTIRAAAGSDGVAAPRPVPSVEQPAPASSSERRGPSRAQAAGIGAVAGAIIGGVTGRSVKAAAIGAAAGGILGTVTVGRTRPERRGNWSRGN